MLNFCHIVAEPFPFVRIPVPLKSGISDKGKNITLCVLCVSSEVGGNNIPIC